MEEYSIILKLLFLIGGGCVIGILVTIIMVNMKLSTLIQNMSELNKNLSNMKVNSTPYKNELNTHASSIKEEQRIQDRINFFQRTENLNQVKKQNTEETIKNVNNQNSNQKKEPAVVGIVFCRYCASNFTSDKEKCPICGAKRSY